MTKNETEKVKEIAQLAVDKVDKWLTTGQDDWDDLDDNEDKFLAVECDIEIFFDKYIEDEGTQFLINNMNSIISLVVDYLNE